MRNWAFDNPSIDFLTSDRGSNKRPVMLKKISTVRLNDRAEQIRAF